MTAEEAERVTGQPWSEGNPQWEKMHAHYYYKQGIDVSTANDDPSIIVVEQVSLTERGYIYTQRELIEKGRYLYPDKKYKIVPLTYQLNVDDITPEWIQEQMALYGVKPKDLAKQLALTKSSVSIVINGTRPIAASTKALIYYYFLSLKLGRIAYMDIQASELSEALELIREKRASQGSSATASPQARAQDREDIGLD